MSLEMINCNKDDFLKNACIIIDNEIPLMANLSNLSRLIYESFPNTSWAGFYLVESDKSRLFLGPFQGSMACTIIPFGKGVCGQAILQMGTQLVPNVHNYPGHIACSSKTNSEIVVPIIKDGIRCGVIDLDSDILNNYSIEDVIILEELATIISKLF